MTPLPMQTQCGSKPTHDADGPFIIFCCRKLPLLDAHGSFGTGIRCARTMLYYLCTWLHSSARLRCFQSRLLLHNPMIPPIQGPPHCTPPYDSKTLGNKAVLQPAIGLSVSVRIVDAGYFPARSYMYHLPGSMTEMPGEVVTPHNLFAFPTVVE